MWKSQDTTDPSRNVGAGVAATICMMQLSNELQLELSTADRFAPDIDDAAAMACQDQLALQPFILDALVEDTGKDVVLGRVADWLVHQHFSVQCVHGDAVTPTDNGVSCYIVDSSTLAIC